MTSIIVFIKNPQPGQVKTRLGKTIGHALAAEFYRLFIEETLRRVSGLTQVQKWVAFAPREMEPVLVDLVPPGFDWFPQEGKDLGERMANAFRRAFAAGAENAVILGSDSPTLPVARSLQDCVNKLDDYDLVIGPAEDGGYYLIGCSQLFPELFEHMTWSSDSVLPVTLSRASEMGLRTHLLDLWYDIDDLATLRRAVQDAPDTAIARLYQAHPELHAI